MPSTEKTIALENIKKGSFLSWEMSTNAANRISVILRDDSKIYVNNSSEGLPRKVLAEGYEKVAGNNLRMTIKVENSQSAPPLSIFTLPYSVPRPNGTLVGNGYNIMMEDQTDGDYNDLVVLIYSCNSDV